MTRSLMRPLGAMFLSLSLVACGNPIAAEATPANPVLGIDLGGAPGAAPPAAGRSGHEGMHHPQRGVVMAHSGHAQAPGTGTVNAVDAAKRTVNVSHGPIPALGWPSMRMELEVGPAVNLQALQPGMRIDFTIEHAEGDRYIIQSVRPAGGGR